MEIDENELKLIFIKKSKRMKKKLMDLLLKFNTLENQIPSETLRSAINSISNTIASISEGNSTLDEIKRYKLNISLFENDIIPPINIEINLEQNKNSHPIPLNHFIEILFPLQEPIKTKTIKKIGTKIRFNENIIYSERTIHIVNNLISNDIEFRIFKISNILGKKKNVLISLATANLSQLVFSTSTSIPLHFINVDGLKSNFNFNLILTTDFPLIPKEEFIINEIIDVIPDNNFN